MTKEEHESFCAAAAPLIKWIGENVDINHVVIVNTEGATLTQVRGSTDEDGFDGN